MKNYSFLKTLKKFLIVLAEVLIAGAIVYATENPSWIFLVPVLEAMRNMLKHGVGIRFI